jgi:hypothetical protein
LLVDGRIRILEAQKLTDPGSGILLKVSISVNVHKTEGKMIFCIV